MANYVVPMDVDDIENDFDNKENTFNSNVLPKISCMEKGYEDMDVSDLNIKLRYPTTLTSTPMSKSYTANCNSTIVEANDLPENENLTRSLGPIPILNDTSIKTKPLPLNIISLVAPQLDDHRSPLNQNDLDRTLTLDDQNVIRASGSNDIDDNISFPSSSSSSLSTPIATSPTAENLKPSGSPIMRGLKSVLNMFRPSQSPITPFGPDGDNFVDKKSITPESSIVDGDAQRKSQVLASTPIASQKKEETEGRLSSPLKDSIVFKENFVNDLQWNNESTIIFSKEKIPIHKLFPQQTPIQIAMPLSESTSSCNDYAVIESEELNHQKAIHEQNLNMSIEPMDISYNDIKDKTIKEIKNLPMLSESELLNDSNRDDSIFVDCENTFTVDTHNESELLRTFNDAIDSSITELVQEQENVVIMNNTEEINMKTDINNKVNEVLNINNDTLEKVSMGSTEANETKLRGTTNNIETNTEIQVKLLPDGKQYITPSDIDSQSTLDTECIQEKYTLQQSLYFLSDQFMGNACSPVIKDNVNIQDSSNNTQDNVIKKCNVITKNIENSIEIEQPLKLFNLESGKDLKDENKIIVEQQNGQIATSGEAIAENVTQEQNIETAIVFEQPLKLSDIESGIVLEGDNNIIVDEQNWQIAASRKAITENVTQEQNIEGAIAVKQQLKLSGIESGKVLEDDNKIIVDQQNGQMAAGGETIVENVTQEQNIETAIEVEQPLKLSDIESGKVLKDNSNIIFGQQNVHNAANGETLDIRQLFAAANIDNNLEKSIEIIQENDNIYKSLDVVTNQVVDSTCSKILEDNVNITLGSSYCTQKNNTDNNYHNMIIKNIENVQEHLQNVSESTAEADNKIIVEQQISAIIPNLETINAEEVTTQEKYSLEYSNTTVLGLQNMSNILDVSPTTGLNINNTDEDMTFQKSSKAEENVRASNKTCTSDIKDENVAADTNTTNFAEYVPENIKCDIEITNPEQIDLPNDKLKADNLNVGIVSTNDNTIIDNGKERIESITHSEISHESVVTGDKQVETPSIGIDTFSYAETKIKNLLNDTRNAIKSLSGINEYVSDNLEMCNNNVTKEQELEYIKDSDEIIELVKNIAFNEPPINKTVSVTNNPSGTVHNVNCIAADIDFETIENPFATKTKIRISPSNSPLRDDPEVNINFQETEHTFVTNSEITMFPPPIVREDIALINDKSSTLDNLAIKSANTVEIEDKNKFKEENLDLMTNTQHNDNSNLNNIVDNSFNIKNLDQSSEHIIDTKKGTEQKETIEMSEDKIGNTIGTVIENTTTMSADAKPENINMDQEVIGGNVEFHQNKIQGSASSTSTYDYVSSSEQSVYFSTGTLSSMENFESKPIDSCDLLVANKVKENINKSATFCFEYENPFQSKSKLRSSPDTSTMFITNEQIKGETNYNVNDTFELKNNIATDINIDNSKEFGTNEPQNITDGSLSSESSKNAHVKSSDSEINTEDEDTIEGAPCFLEAESDSIENERNCGDKMELNPFTDANLLCDDNLGPGEMFIDAETYEFLINQNGNNVVDNGKESLFLKFDPLCAAKVSADGDAAALRKFQKLQKSPFKKVCETPTKDEDTLNLTFGLCVNEEVSEEVNETVLHKPTMAVMPAVNTDTVVTSKTKYVTPVRSNRQSVTFTSPAIAVIDRLLSCSINNSPAPLDTTGNTFLRERNEAEIALTQLRELLSEKEQNIQHLQSESLELKSRLTTLETQMNVLETENKDKLQKINDLNERLVNKTKMNRNMASVVEEYERTIAGLIADTEQEKKLHAEERIKLINERDEQTAHLASMEVSFCDLHSKYEKSKQVILTYKANEETLLKSVVEFEGSLKKMENNYELLKQHATAKLNQANQELEKINRAHESEVLKLNAMIKRKDLHITSLEETLVQKTKANEELTAICDELINKVG